MMNKINVLILFLALSSVVLAVSQMPVGFVVRESLITGLQTAPTTFEACTQQGCKVQSFSRSGFKRVSQQFGNPASLGCGSVSILQNRVRSICCCPIAPVPPVQPPVPLAPPAAPFDINVDGVVDEKDVDTVKGVALGTQTCPTSCDFNKDGVVNAVDIQRITNAVIEFRRLKEPFDLNADGVVDVKDQEFIIDIVLGKKQCPPGPSCDFTNDGVVNAPDIQSVINRILQVPRVCPDSMLPIGPGGECKCLPSLCPLDSSLDQKTCKCVPVKPPTDLQQAVRDAEARVAEAQKELDARIAEVQRLKELVKQAEQAVEQARKALAAAQGEVSPTSTLMRFATNTPGIYDLEFTNKVGLTYIVPVVSNANGILAYERFGRRLVLTEDVPVRQGDRFFVNNVRIDFTTPLTVTIVDTVNKVVFIADTPFGKEPIERQAIYDSASKKGTLVVNGIAHVFEVDEPSRSLFIDMDGDGVLTFARVHIVNQFGGEIEFSKIPGTIFLRRRAKDIPSANADVLTDIIVKVVGQDQINLEVPSQESITMKQVSDILSTGTTTYGAKFELLRTGDRGSNILSIAYPRDATSLPPAPSDLQVAQEKVAALQAKVNAQQAVVNQLQQEAINLNDLLRRATVAGQPTQDLQTRVQQASARLNAEFAVLENLRRDLRTAQEELQRIQALQPVPPLNLAELAQAAGEVQKALNVVNSIIARADPRKGTLTLSRDEQLAVEKAKAPVLMLLNNAGPLRQDVATKLAAAQQSIVSAAALTAEFGGTPQDQLSALNTAKQNLEGALASINQAGK